MSRVAGRGVPLRPVLVLTIAVFAGVFVPIAAAVANFGAAQVADCGFMRNPPVSGHNPNNKCVMLANNRFHAVRFQGLANSNGWIGIDTAMQWAITNRLDPTDMVAYRDDDDPLPDVKVFDNRYGDDWPVAWVDCPANNTGTGGSGASQWCRGQILRFNACRADEFPDQAARRRLACHELGHTVGLRHNQHGAAHNSCMRTQAQLNVNTYSDHEIEDHINANY